MDYASERSLTDGLSPAGGTASRSRARQELARYAKWRDSSAWEKAIRTCLPKSQKPMEIYRALGWSKATVSRRRKRPDLRISELVAIALLLEIEPGRFLSLLLSMLAPGELSHVPPTLRPQNQPELILHRRHRAPSPTPDA